MALDTKTIKDTYPLPVYNYRVEIGPDTIGFAEVSGLNIVLETSVYKESQTEAGLTGPKILLMPSVPNHVNVTLKKGLVRTKSMAALYNWIKTTQLNLIEKKDIFVRLCDEKGAAVISWKIVNAFPIKLEAPSFDAKSNDVAIESMEVMADKIIIE
jgi:phage tail-like protein